jgi:hypothetical protein
MIKVCQNGLSMERCVRFGHYFNIGGSVVSTFFDPVVFIDLHTNRVEEMETGLFALGFFRPRYFGLFVLDFIRPCVITPSIFGP